MLLTWEILYSTACTLYNHLDYYNLLGSDISSRYITRSFIDEAVGQKTAYRADQNQSDNYYVSDCHVKYCHITCQIKIDFQGERMFFEVELVVVYTYLLD